MQGKCCRYEDEVKIIGGLLLKIDYSKIIISTRLF
jgi:hypothetical protein